LNGQSILRTPPIHAPVHNHSTQEPLKRWCILTKLAKRPKPAVVIPPFLMALSRRIQAAIFSFMAGVMPPMPMLGRSLL
jgi:hypothetical protein